MRKDTKKKEGKGERVLSMNYELELWRERMNEGVKEWVRKRAIKRESERWEFPILWVVCFERSEVESGSFSALSLSLFLVLFQYFSKRKKDRKRRDKGWLMWTCHGDRDPLILSINSRMEGIHSFSLSLILFHDSIPFLPHFHSLSLSPYHSLPLFHLDSWWWCDVLTIDERAAAIIILLLSPFFLVSPDHHHYFQAARKEQNTMMKE